MSDDIVVYKATRYRFKKRHRFYHWECADCDHAFRTRSRFLPRRKCPRCKTYALYRYLGYKSV